MFVHGLVVVCENRRKNGHTIVFLLSLFSWLPEFV